MNQVTVNSNPFKTAIGFTALDEFHASLPGLNEYVANRALDIDYSPAPWSSGTTL